MDPDAALERLRELAKATDPDGDGDYEDPVYLLEEMAVVFDGLDQWLSSGGFLPQAWQKRPESAEEVWGDG